MDRWATWWRAIRDVLTFALGAFIAVQEVRSPTIDVEVLIFAGGLMGLPGVLRSE